MSRKRDGSTFQERLQVIVEKCENATVLAQQSGVGRRTIGWYLSGQRLPTINTLIALAEGARVRPEWLLTGDLPMEEDSEATDVDVSGGGKGFRPTGAGVRFHQIARAFELDTKSFDVVKVSGSTMEPALRNGDILVIDVSVNTISGDGLYVLGDLDAPVIRRIETLANGDLKLLGADNAEYGSVPKGKLENLAVAGMVRWISKRT